MISIGFPLHLRNEDSEIFTINPEVVFILLNKFIPFSFCPAIFTAFLASSNALAQKPTVGPVEQVCSNITQSNGTVTATCPDFFNQPVHSSLANTVKCTHSNLGLSVLTGKIYAVDGALRCVYSTDVNISKRDIFDIVSLASDTVSGSTETKVWRIDHPNVISSTTYSEIPLLGGDRLVIAAGGCVQTGGKGLTWKSYVSPSGDESDHLYSGVILAPPVIPVQVRIGAGIATWQVPSTFFNLVSVTLSYQDDAPGDNGYYSHDNGNNNQCLGIGPAWVQITQTFSTSQHS